MEFHNDYYCILDLKRDATDSQIKQAYRKFALKHHPLKSGNDEGAAAQFRMVAEAYDVLADPQRRAIFDQYGEKGLKEGTSNGKGGRAGGYVMTANPEELFAEHFGTTSPFAEFFAVEKGKADSLFQSYQQTEAKKVASQEINLYVSLEELYAGASKSHKVIRKRLAMDGRTMTLEEKIFTIEIGAGWKENTKITFAKEGDEFPGQLNEPGDIIFLLKTKPHPRFTRKGADITYIANLTLMQALTGTTLEIATLDNRIIPIGINEVATPTGTKVVPGEGLINPKTGVKGNMVIEFNITFPQQLSTEQKNQIKKILGPASA